VPASTDKRQTVAHCEAIRSNIDAALRQETIMSDTNVVARFLSFDRERNGGASPPDFAENYDAVEANGRTAALVEYLDGYITEHNRAGVVTIKDADGNAFTIACATGEALLVRCYGADIFVLIRFPTSDEIAKEQCIFHEWANDLDTDMMITLVRRFIRTGAFSGDIV
jgi:hypothetical protein